ncbi:MAG TPA: mercuric reductase [Gemmatimonadaceae bacterium]|nr:mercuric reductase [Gemmatimonadaceae bacterium]
MTRTFPDPPADWPGRFAAPPFDAPNAHWAGNVSPRGWPLPPKRDRYHLVVIGGGTAGLVSAAIGAGLGARVALVERAMLGGDCLNVGCVPSKAVIRAARGWHDARGSAAAFGGPRASGDGDFAAAMARLRGLRAGLSDVDSAARFRGLGVDVFLSDAAFVAPDAVRIGDRTVRFRRAIVATGARAAVPLVPGLADTPFDTNETIFTVTERPRHLIVVGGGPIGAELAQAFARLGTAVTLVNAGPRLLPREDADAAELVSASLRADGVAQHHDHRLTSVSYAGAEFTVTATGAQGSVTIRGDRLLIATGRAPNVDNLGLDAAGIAYSPTGITVNDRLRTSNRRVYAIGDVSSPLQFTHVADAQARLAVPNALFFGIGGGRNSKLVVPRVTYTSPEVAHVGLTPAEAEAAGRKVETVTVELSHVDRAVLDGADGGFLKVHLRAGSDRILGGTLVADHAGEMIGELAVAITNRLGLGALGGTIHAYPTQAEVYRRAADAWRRTRLTPLARRLFGAWFSLFR